MPAKLSDEEMIQQYWLTQPAHCFEALYKRYVSKVYKRCLSMTNDAEQAQDFTHDIFIKIFEKLSSFQQRSSFSTWLYSVSHNHCLDQLRAAQKKRMIALEDQMADCLPDLEEDGVPEEVFQLVQEAMLALSPNEKILLRAKYEDQMSISSIAQQYQLSNSAVKMRLKRVRDKIQRLYCQEYSFYLSKQQ